MVLNTSYIDKIQVEGKQIHAGLVTDVLLIFRAASNNIDDESAAFQIERDSSGVRRVGRSGDD